jgi:ankyrin repeat protein
MCSPSRFIVLGIAVALSASHSPAVANPSGNLQPQALALAQLDLAGMALEGPLLVRAAAAGHRPLIEIAIAAGADVNSTDENGCTALLAATVAKDWNLVELLLKKGADPKRASNGGVTPLMAAAAVGHLPSLTELLNRGASTEAADQEGRTALHYAVAGRQPLAVQRLLEALGDSAIKGNDAQLSALAFATRDWKIVEPILQRQAPVATWTTDARALLDQALLTRDAAKARLLISRHSSAPTPEGKAQPLLAHALIKGDMKTFQFLLECGADPNTPLHSPAEKEFCDLAPSKVLRHYLSTEPGMTTLMLAAGLANAEGVKLLLEKGASRSQASASKHKLVPLYFAAWADSSETLQVLLGGGPKPEELRIEISLATQRAALIRGGVPVFTTKVSSGKPGHTTPAGEFVITDKKSSHISSIYKVKMPFFMRLNCRDFGLHQGIVPDYPASHGCIRVPSDAARKLFQDVPIGTLVSIR